MTRRRPAGRGVRATRSSRSRRAEGHARRRSRTSCSASPARSRAPTSCGSRSPTRSCPLERRIAVVEDLIGGKALAGEHRARRDDRRRRPGRASCRRSSTAFVELAAAEREHEVAEVRIGDRRSTTRRPQRLADGARAGPRASTSR